MAPEELARALVGRVALPWVDPGSPDRALLLAAYRPANHTPDRPVVIVQHGMGRNGEEYRDAWIPTADRHGVLIVAPTFPLSDWPNSRVYNDGHVRAADGTVRPRDTWSNGIPGRVLAALQAAGVTTRSRAYLWGHSAGGQFVHRLVSLQGGAAFEAVGAANAGWYSLPTLDRPYPEGLGGVGLDEAAVERLLAYPMTIFAGDQDIETKATNLPKGAAALAQGPHRFARAHHYLAFAQAEAARRGVPCRWTLKVVPGVGHEGMVMSDVAGRWWFDGEEPAPRAAGRKVSVEL